MWTVWPRYLSWRTSEDTDDQVLPIGDAGPSRSGHEHAVEYREITDGHHACG